MSKPPLAIKWTGENFIEIKKFCPELIDMGCDCNPNGNISWPLKLRESIIKIGHYVYRDSEGKFHHLKKLN